MRVPARRLLLVAALAVAGGVLARHELLRERPPEEKGARAQPPLPAAPPSARAGETRSETEAGATRQRAVEEFRRRYGPALEPRFLPDGRLAGLARPGRDEAGAAPEGPLPAGFSPRSEAAVRERAERLLADLAPALAAAPDLPIRLTGVRVGEASAQAFATQSLDGAPLAPVGTVTLNLGPRGELLAVYASYVTGVRVANRRAIDSDAARARAEAAVEGPRSSSIRTEGGREVLWVLEGGARPEARRAYEFLVQGRQVVVDAQSGEILALRDARQD